MLAEAVFILVWQRSSEVSTEVVFVTEKLRVSGRGRKWWRSSVFTSLVELVVKSCVELLRSCGINILAVFSDIPVFWLDNKLPTTLKHRTRNNELRNEHVKFLLVSSSVRSKQLLWFVQGQGQKREQKHTTKKFDKFCNHSPVLTMFCRESNLGFLKEMHPKWKRDYS